MYFLFIDLFFIGDGDELNIKVMKRFAQLKKQGLSRSEILKKLSEIEGIYSPEFSKKVVMKQVCNLSLQKAPSKPIVPFSNCVHDRAVVELRRGCGRMCRFCQAGHTNLPIRERSKEDVLEIADLILQF